MATYFWYLCKCQLVNASLLQRNSMPVKCITVPHMKVFNKALPRNQGLFLGFGEAYDIDSIWLVGLLFLCCDDPPADWPATPAAIGLRVLRC